MTATALRDSPDPGTSALGSMYRSDEDINFGATLNTTPLKAVTTGTCYQGLSEMLTFISLNEKCTTADPVGKIHCMPAIPAESTAEAIMEIRRRSGFTWEELGDLFDVSRRSVHLWANGNPVTAIHGQTIHRMLAAFRHLDQGNRNDTRALLLTVDPVTGQSTVDLLKKGRFDEIMGRQSGVRVPERQPIPLSRAASDTYRPQKPMLLLEAEQDRPEIPANARAIRPVRATG